MSKINDTIHHEDTDEGKVQALLDHFAVNDSDVGKVCHSHPSLYPAYLRVVKS
jgi:hypothetical protein